MNACDMVSQLLLDGGRFGLTWAHATKAQGRTLAWNKKLVHVEWGSDCGGLNSTFGKYIFRLGGFCGACEISPSVYGFYCLCSVSHDLWAAAPNLLWSSRARRQYGTNVCWGLPLPGQTGSLLKLKYHFLEVDGWVLSWESCAKRRNWKSGFCHTKN